LLLGTVSFSALACSPGKGPERLQDQKKVVRHARYQSSRGIRHIKAQLVVARKTELIYNKFNGNTNQLYDHLITVHFKDKLHTSSEIGFILQRAVTGKDTNHWKMRFITLEKHLRVNGRSV
jgi:hypothetical protein